MYIISVKSKMISFDSIKYAYAGYLEISSDVHFGNNGIMKSGLTNADNVILFETIGDAKKWLDYNKEILISKYGSNYDLKHVHILEIKNSLDINLNESDPSIVKYLDYEFKGSINCCVILNVGSDGKVTLRSSYGEVIEENIDMKDLEKIIDDLENGKYA